MIRRTVSAALLLRDGFTGAALTNGAATVCLLDGKPLRQPIWKRDGYLVLTDLTPGEHSLSIRRSGYRDETVALTVTEDAAVEDTVCLKPGHGYRFPAGTVRVTLTLRGATAGETLWLGVRPRTQLKLAQERAEPGDDMARLFCEGSPALLPIPGHFLLDDKGQPELVYLRSLRAETAEFAPPLTLGHGRGAELFPMQPYEPDAAGSLQVLLREPGTLKGYCGGRLFEAALQEGEQNIEWDLEG